MKRTYILEVFGSGESHVFRAAQVFELAAASLYAEAGGGPVVSGQDERHSTPNATLTHLPDGAP